MDANDTKIKFNLTGSIHVCKEKTISPGARYDLFLSEAPKGQRDVSYVEFTQESETLFLMIIQVDLRHEILLQCEVLP